MTPTFKRQKRKGEAEKRNPEYDHKTHTRHSVLFKTHERGKDTLNRIEIELKTKATYLYKTLQPK